MAEPPEEGRKKRRKFKSDVEHRCYLKLMQSVQMQLEGADVPKDVEFACIQFFCGEITKDGVVQVLKQHPQYAQRSLGIISAAAKTWKESEVYKTFLNIHEKREWW